MSSQRNIAACFLPLAAAAFGLVFAVLANNPARALASRPPLPNIVVISTDDQAAYTVNRRYMPKTIRRFATATNFSDFVASNPLCCPSRASLYTGQYSHNHGVTINDYGLLRDRFNVLPAWLQNAGYKTAHIGKFMNGYEDAVADPLEPAPGWDRWFSQVDPRRYYDYSLSVNGRRRRYGEADRDYLTTVMSNRAVRTVGSMAANPEPFYLHLDFYAPHIAPGRDESCASAAKPGPADEGRYVGEPLRFEQLGLGPDVTSFDEVDLSDKPGFIRDTVAPDPGLSADAIARIRDRWACALGSISSVDRGIDRVFAAVEDSGELGRTVFLFTSDNGFYFGEHRIQGGKPYAYEENLKMPLMLRVPKDYLGGVNQIRAASQPTANIDIAPTLLELARARPCTRPRHCRVMDGRSLVGLLSGDLSGWPAERAISVERGDCTFRGIRLDQQVYFAFGRVIRHHGSEPICVPTEDFEHYDLGSDPFEINNLYPATRGTPLGDLQDELEAHANRLARCSGIEGRDPPPLHGGYCE